MIQASQTLRSFTTFYQPFDKAEAAERLMSLETKYMNTISTPNGDVVIQYYKELNR